MPELPEVEVSRLGLLPHLPGRRVREVVVRAAKLRHEIPPELPELLAGKTLKGIARRGKYLLFDFGDGTLILHLGMSGSLRLVAPDTPAQKHDHVDIAFPRTVLRLRDPRRFGTIAWCDCDPARHPLLSALGQEPLAPEFDGDWLYRALRHRTIAVKPALMDGHMLVGVGNIYASESLFRAGISPLRAANRISRQRCEQLAAAVRATLEASIAAGGSSVRDYVHSDGGAGCFQLECAVYDREGAPCLHCGAPIRSARQAGRSTYWCPRCQT